MWEVGFVEGSQIFMGNYFELLEELRVDKREVEYIKKVQNER